MLIADAFGCQPEKLQLPRYLDYLPSRFLATSTRHHCTNLSNPVTEIAVSGFLVDFNDGMVARRQSPKDCGVHILMIQNRLIVDVDIFNIMLWFCFTLARNLES